jgi:hypothetical protein
LLRPAIEFHKLAIITGIPIAIYLVATVEDFEICAPESLSFQFKYGCCGDSDRRSFLLLPYHPL